MWERGGGAMKMDTKETNERKMGKDGTLVEDEGLWWTRKDEGTDKDVTRKQSEKYKLKA